ncbi:MAG: threonine--tRNA ligase [Lachnospiraceae bacterium]|nr:threonine--tRNA ligase [Lachnospiraceae bacterium]
MKVIYNDGTVAECPSEEVTHVLRHSAAHIMAQAIQRLYPNADFAYGPATERGFYYDVDLGDEKLSDEDLENIEKEMRKIVKENLPFKTFVLPREEAVALMRERGEKYKEEHIGDLDPDATISFYQQGDYIDMCVGPHITYTKALKAFKITGQSGAYWKNDAKNKMLTRINGVAFQTQDELAEYEREVEEAKARDHRKIGKEMSLFMSDDLVGKGLPMFLPKGYTLWQELENYIKEKERKLGYQHVMTPCVGTVALYETSGHWAHYKENMFPAMEVEGERFVLRPMNCPHHMMIYANKQHSYRELPIRIGEIAHDFRFESSGTLKGIERGRHFCQNDAHLFVTPDQIEAEVGRVVDLIFDVYKDFGIENYRCVLSLRDPADTEKYHPDDDMWNKAEDALRRVLNDLHIDFTEEIGEAAFYGPKLDVNVKPAVGAEYTLSTCQLDFCLPAKFDLKYTDNEGVEQTPVVLHRAILGSLDRFMAYIIEETKGKFPVWLAPLQVKVLPVSDKTMEYATKVYEAIDEAGIRTQLDTRNEKIGYKIREAQQVDRAPYMLVIGAKEAENGNISVRSRDTGEITEMSLDEFIAKVKNEIETKAH